MNKHILAILGLSCLVCAAHADTTNTASTTVTSAGAGNSVLTNDTAKMSYAIGMTTGMSIKQNDLKADPDLIAQGLKDVLSGNPTLMNDQEMHDEIRKIQTTIRAKFMAKQKEAEEKRKVEAVKNKQAGEAFLADNGKKDGVITLTNGLQYKVITEGQGDSPKADEMATVNYRGTLIDGTEFDSSAKQGHPAAFRVNGVIPGWTQALEMMKPGSKWQLFIPSNLAYGDMGRPGIPPGSTLIFDVELVSVSAAPAPVTHPPQPLTSDIIKVPSADELKKGAKIETIKAEDVNKATTNGN